MPVLTEKLRGPFFERVISLLRIQIGKSDALHLRLAALPETTITLRRLS
jgi:hypothetical protein